MVQIGDTISLRTLLRRFPGRIAVTWGLVLVETALFALLPLLIGWSIDGLLSQDTGPFWQLCGTLGVLLMVATGRRVFDTRAYGTMRAAFGRAQSERRGTAPVSRVNAQVLMGRELVDFLETTVPETMTAFVQVVASVIVLAMFSTVLAGAALGAALVMLAIYGAFARLFFRLNGRLNARTERQVAILSAAAPRAVAAHFMGLRRHEVRLSDAESLIYGLIFAALLVMLTFNLWYGATQVGASPGEIFSIVTYSMEFLQAAVMLPIALQHWTRLAEITQRINADQTSVNKT
ncbi:MAG: ABC transporter six-transmembrane domain-containing protein [Pseudomonadota bacterium]